MVVASEPRRVEPRLGHGDADLEQQVRGLRLVHELAVALHAPMDLAPLLELVLDVVIQVHGARHGVLYLYRGDGLAIATARGLDGVAGAERRQLAQHVHAVGHERHVIADTERDPSHHALVEVSRRMGVRAIHRTPIRSRGGRLLGVVAAHLDEPRAPTALEIQLADLCARHAADALDSGEAFEQIRCAKEAAERANRTKDEFVAMLGHELRSPLSAISCAVELLGGAADEQEGRTARAIIARQVDHLTRLVGDLLDVARINEGQLELERAPVDVAEAIARATELAAVACKRRAQTVVVSAPRGLIVHGDVTRLTQVIANLVVNAAKYSEPNKRVTITARRRDHEIEIAVRDQGIGIAREMLPRLFEPYAQERRVRAYAQGGLGLGLAIVHKLVALHGGRVGVDSDGVGHGCTFRVVLPAWAPATTPGRDRTSRRILVVDPNPAVAAMLAELLHGLGHVACVATDGDAAVAVAREVTPEIALIDLGLPAADAFTLAGRLRADGPPPRLIAIAGYRKDVDIPRARAAGFAGWLFKPLSLGAVVRALDAPADP